MKTKFSTLLLFGALLSNVQAQQNQVPYTTPFASNPAGAVNTANAAWYRGGNTPCGGAANANIFGTLWNSPIYTQTDAITRTRLNGTWTTTVNTVTKPFDGYFGIGPNGFFQNNTPWSMLHLEGGNNTLFGGNGWRRWMETGVFMKENSDAMYVGLKQEEGSNRSDAVVNWSDDSLCVQIPDFKSSYRTNAQNWYIGTDGVFAPQHEVEHTSTECLSHKRKTNILNLSVTL